jgi:hypothetical protein
MTFTAKDLLEFATFAVATGAFGVGLWQGYLARLHNRLVVRPALTWQRNIEINDGGLVEVTFSFENSGVGPAVIRDRYFLVDRERFAPKPGEDEVQALVAKLVGDRMRHQLRQHGLPAVNAAFPEGRCQVIAKILFIGASIDTVKAFLQTLPEVRFRATYESLYGERFELKGGGD